MADVDLPEIEVQAPPPPKYMPPLSEYATLVVGGRRFQDWTSVWVQENWGDQYASFRFSAVDAVNLPTTPPTLLQFKPGDDCDVYLGPFRAMRGTIVGRQAAYDAKSRGAVLDGRSASWYASTSSILDKKSRYTGSLLDIAAKVLAPTGVRYTTVGDIPSRPFKPFVANEPGEQIGSFLERLARNRNVLLGSNASGDFVFIGEHVGKIVDTLTEGVNILKCQCMIRKEGIYSLLLTRGQSAANDEQNGRQSAEMEATAKGSATRYRALLTPMELPVWTLDEVVMRNNHELMWSEGDEVTANVTVYGWFTRKGTLWQAGDDVLIESTMAMLHQVLKIQTVTFTQDRQQGSLTTLTCVAPWRLKDIIPLTRGVRSSPSSSTPNTEPAETPPAAPEAQTPPAETQE